MLNSSIHSWDTVDFRVLWAKSQAQIDEVTFRFPEFVSACKKIVYSIYSFLRCSQFPSTVTRVVTPIFPMPTQKFFSQLLIFMTLYQTQKIRLLHRFVLEIKLIKNPAIWLVISNSVQITGARFLLNMRFAQEYSK